MSTSGVSDAKIVYQAPTDNVDESFLQQYGEAAVYYRKFAQHRVFMRRSFAAAMKLKHKSTTGIPSSSSRNTNSKKRSRNSTNIAVSACLFFHYRYTPHSTTRSSHEEPLQSVVERHELLVCPWCSRLPLMGQIRLRAPDSNTAAIGGTTATTVGACTGQRKRGETGKCSATVDASLATATADLDGCARWTRASARAVYALCQHIRACHSAPLFNVRFAVDETFNLHVSFTPSPSPSFSSERSLHHRDGSFEAMGRAKEFSWFNDGVTVSSSELEDDINDDEYESAHMGCTNSSNSRSSIHAGGHGNSRDFAGKELKYVYPSQQRRLEIHHIRLLPEVENTNHFTQQTATANATAVEIEAKAEAERRKMPRYFHSQTGVPMTSMQREFLSAGELPAQPRPPTGTGYDISTFIYPMCPPTGSLADIRPPSAAITAATTAQSLAAFSPSASAVLVRSERGLDEYDDLSVEERFFFKLWNRHIYIISCTRYQDPDGDVGVDYKHVSGGLVRSRAGKTVAGGTADIGGSAGGSLGTNKGKNGRVSPASASAAPRKMVGLGVPVPLICDASCTFTQYGDSFVPWSCELFIRTYRVELVENDCRFLLLAHFLNLFDFGLLSAADLKKLMFSFDAYVAHVRHGNISSSTGHGSSDINN